MRAFGMTRGPDALRVALVLVALAVARPAHLQAQAFIGFPQGSAGAVGAVFGFPEGGTAYSLSGMAASSSSDVFFQGQFGIVSPDDDGFSNTKSVIGTLAYEIRALAKADNRTPAVPSGCSIRNRRRTQEANRLLHGPQLSC